MNETTTQAPESTTSGPGPGDRLAAARISSGLSIAEIANRMHLSIAILTSLEENNFDEITAPIFVKGYLRSYARIVNVDEQEIIQQYTSYYTEDDPPITSTSNTSPEINADDGFVKWITRLVILGLVVLLSLWWWNRYQQPAETLSLDSSDQTGTSLALTTDDASQETMPMTSENTVETPRDESLMQQVEAELANMENPTSDEDVISVQPELETQVEPVVEVAAEVDTQVEPRVEPMVESQVTAVEGIVGAETVGAETVSSETVGAEPVVEDSAAQQEPLMAQDGLVITVNADTWADIKDADGNNLVYDLLRSGDTISVNGKTPIRAFLGNGYGVSMQYKGEDVDLSAVIRADNTARIYIGQ